MTDATPNESEKEAQAIAAEAAGPGASGPPPAPASTASSGTVQAFRDIRRELTTEELSNPGVQKLILNSLDNALARCEALAGFEARFHESDKRVAVLQEKLAKRVALDIAWTAGVAVGLAIITTVSALPADQTSTWRLPLIVLGAILIMGGIAIRVVLR